MRAWQIKDALHAAGLRSDTFNTIPVGCKRPQMFRVVTCPPFLILPATVHSGGQPVGSSFMTLTAIANRYSIDSN
jgi:hypothetical protein